MEECVEEEDVEMAYVTRRRHEDGREEEPELELNLNLLELQNQTAVTTGRDTVAFSDLSFLSLRSGKWVHRHRFEHTILVLFLQ